MGYAGRAADAAAITGRCTPRGADHGRQRERGSRAGARLRLRGVPCRGRHRPRRDGCRLPGRGARAPAHGGPQAHSPGAFARRALSRALPPRVQARGFDRPPEHHSHPRGRRRGRRALHHDAARRGHGPQGPDRRAGPPRSAPSGAYRQPGRRRARRRPRPRPGASRCQAAQRPPRARRPRVPQRLRARKAGRLGRRPDTCGVHRRARRVRGARADRQRARRRARRRLRARLPAVRGADRRGAVRQGPGCARAGAPPGSGAVGRRAAPRPAARVRRGRAAGDGQATERALSVRGRPGAGGARRHRGAAAGAGGVGRRHR